MSYILDALRRAERERHREAGDPVAEVATSTPPPAPAPRRLRVVLVVLGVLILVLLAINVALMLHSRRVTPTTHTEQTTTKQAGTQRSPTGVPAGPRVGSHVENTPTPTHRSDSSQPPTGASASGGSLAVSGHAAADELSVPKLIPAGTSTGATPVPNPIAGAGAIHTFAQLTVPPLAKPKPEKRPKVRPAPKSHLAAAASNSVSASPGSHPTRPPAPGTGSATIKTIPSPPIPPVAQSSSPTRTSVAPPLPEPSATDLKMMPDSYRAKFPQITVQVHVYDPDPTQSWVMINGRRYRQGDSLPQGPKIDQIVPQGIVFDWKGREVLYPT